MGNKAPKQQKSVVEEDYQSYINHPKIKDVTIRRTNKQHQYMETYMPIFDKKDYDVWVKSLKHSPADKSRYALHPRKYDLKKESTCGKSGTAKIQYDNYSYTLKQQIINRREAGFKQFDETQIWYLLNCLSDVAEKFHENKQKVGDIRPSNIFVNNQGQIKVSTKDSWPKQTTNYQKYLFDHQPTLLAPEEINDIQVGRKAPTSNIQTAQSFSIGMTALDSAKLEDSEKMYSKDSIKYDVLDQKRLSIWNDQKYSELLKIVLTNLTSPQFGKRMTSKELRDFLKPNQDKILSFKNFSTGDLPYKLRQTAQQKTQSHYVQSSSYKPKTPQYIPPSQVFTKSSNIPRFSATKDSQKRMTLTRIEQKIAQSKAHNY